MTESELEQLSRAELIQLVLSQAAQLAKVVAELQAEIAELRLKLEKGQKPPPTSSNSSQPPSRDQKSNRASEPGRGRRGPAAGHVKYERPWVAQPDHVVILKARCCRECQTELQNSPGRRVHTHQITELPTGRAEVIEVQEYEVVCPGCGQTQRPEPPVGLERWRTFGARLEASVVYYRQKQHLSYARAEAAWQDLHGMKLSQGGIDLILQRAGQAAAEAAAPLQAEIQQSQVVYSDETGCRVDGQNWWEWVFSSATAVLHVIRFDRSVDVIKATMGQETVEVWVSDCYPAQMKAPAKFHQLCLAHQLRNLQAVVDKTPQAVWPRAVQALFRASIHLHNQRAELSLATFAQERQRLERLCTWLLKRPVLEKEAQRLLHRYQKYRATLFVFLQRSDVSPTNNVSERHLRPSVIHRKVTGCFRSDWGAHTYAALASVIGTAALTGLNAFQAIQNLAGTPALPITPLR